MFRLIIRQQIQKLEQNIAILKKRINRIKGSLAVRNNKGRVEFYCRENSLDKTGSYIGHDRTELLDALAQKKYDQMVLQEFEGQKSDLQKLLSRTEKHVDPVGIYNRLPEYLKSHVTPFVAYNRKEAEKWKAGIRCRLLNISEKHYGTLSGIEVLSKSEVMIADTLHMMGIPFVYEPEVRIPTGDPYRADERKYPDFKVLNMRTGEEFYWEHFGKLDDGQYLLRSLSKLEQFATIGIIQGKNLIVSFESENHPLNRKYITTLIKTFLL